MKKFLPILVLLVLALVFSACNKSKDNGNVAETTADVTEVQTNDTATEGGNASTDADTTAIGSDATESGEDVGSETEATGDDSSAPSEESSIDESSSVEESTSEEESTTEEVTTREPSKILTYDFDAITAKQLKGCFSNPYQTAYDVAKDDDGEQNVKIYLDGGVYDDPSIMFSLQTFSKYAKVATPDAKIFKYVMLKVKNDGIKDGAFYLYYATTVEATISGTKVVSSTYDVDLEDWQYIFFDLSSVENWTGKIVSFRLDYTMTGNEAGEGMYINEISFLSNDIDYYESLGLDFDDIGFDISKENADKADELLSSVTLPTAPSDSYKGETAEHEDASLNLWFDHMYDRTANNDNTSTGKLSYTMMLAKNEREDCQMILSSANGTEGLKVYISDFTNGSGATLQTDIFWGYYFNIEGEKLAEALVPVDYEKDSFMENWMAGNNGASITIVDQQKYNGFDIKAGENQTFVIRVTSAIDSPAGEYSATVRFVDKDGKEVKKATVYAYVWNFTLDEATACKTLMDLDDYNLFVSYGDWAGVLENEQGWGLYEIYYNFLLENRICCYDIPGVQYQNGSGIYTESMMAYVKNPRVVAFQPTGWSKQLTVGGIQTAYETLSENEEWLDKAYFYPVDEPGNVDKLDLINYYGSVLAEYWPEYKLIVPMHLNSGVAGGDYFSYISEYVNVWCPHTYFYTTFGEWYSNKLLTYRNNPAADAKLGSFRDRMWADQEEGKEAWWYVTRFPHDPEITLTINTDAVNYRTLFWQQKLYDVDGFLYYSVNDWTNNSGFWIPDPEQEFLYGFDAHHEANEAYPYNVYGNGILLYSGAYFGQLEPIGCIRLECVRDGIEDFEYLTMLEEIYGYDVVQAIVHTWTQSLGEYNTDTEAFTTLRTQVAMLLEAAANQ